MKIDKTQLPIFPHEIVPNSGRQTGQLAGKDSFVNVLKNKISTASSSVKFSAHAIERLASRNIILTKQDIAKINRAVMKMEEKGGKESLVVMGDLAFVVSVKNKTIITAMDKSPHTYDKIFTNIDSALIM